MKFVFSILIMILSLSAFPYCNREAQFIGNVINLKYYPASENQVEHYSFQIQLARDASRWFRPSRGCPIWLQEFEAATIYEVGYPRRENGDVISGVLVFDQKIQDYLVD